MNPRFASAIGTASLILAVGFAAIAWHRDDARAAVDLSGRWYIELTGLDLNAMICTADMTQTESTVSGDFLCSDIFERTLTGIIEPNSGSFALCGDFGGVDLCLRGTASANEMNGALMKAPYSGTFTGTRILPTPTATPIPPLDMTGDWAINALYPSCILHIIQTDGRLSGATTCGPARIFGTVDVKAKTFTLDWLDPTHDTVSLTGTVDSYSMRGTAELAVTAEPSDFYGNRASVVWGSTACPSSLPVILQPPHYPPLSALRILQYSARELPSGADSCIGRITDVNFDGLVDSRDVVLILQLEAGLIPRLPVL